MGFWELGANEEEVDSENEDGDEKQVTEPNLARLSVDDVRNKWIVYILKVSWRGAFKVHICFLLTNLKSNERH